MATFKYIGRTKAGAAKKGIIQAPNKVAAMTKLRSQGINPRTLEESNSILHKDISLGGKVKTQDFVMYCRQFATLARAGVSIVEATNILARQATSKPLKKALELVEDDIRTGTPLSVAVAKHPKVFPELFTNMMRAGEITGNIDETLERLATTFEKQYRTIKKVQSSMSYPLVMLVLTIGVVIFMLVYLVPSYVASFESMGAELPWITVLTITLSEWLITRWWLLILLTGAIIGIVMFLFKTNERFHFLVHYALLRMPIFGPLVQKTAISRLTRTLSSLFSSGVSILQSLAISEKVSGNPVISQVVIEAKKSLERGSSLTEPLEKSWLFPPMVTSMTEIGESTGSLDYMLEKVADFYEEEVDRTVDNLKALLEPAMILMLALIVGFIVAAILMPMFNLYEQM